MNNRRLIKMASNSVIKRAYILFISICAVIPDKPYLKMMYRIRTGQKLHIEDPVTFNEKIQYLKLFEKDKGYSKYTDKYAVRSYIAEKIGEGHLIPLIGVYDSFDEIDTTSLPEQYVVKCTHDSGSVVVCDSRDELRRYRSQFRKALKRKYYLASRDYTYRGVKPRIVIEQKLDNDGKGLIDYKFYCFDGEPMYLYISEGLQDHNTAQISFYNMDLSIAPFKRKDYQPLDHPPIRPKHYDEMIRIARTLSEGFKFVRVDLYEVDGVVYFSELTFAPCGGYMPFEPAEWDRKLGDHITLSDL